MWRTPRYNTIQSTKHAEYWSQSLPRLQVLEEVKLDRDGKESVFMNQKICLKTGGGTTEIELKTSSLQSLKLNFIRTEMREHSRLWSTTHIFSAPSPLTRSCATATIYAALRQKLSVPVLIRSTINNNGKCISTPKSYLPERASIGYLVNCIKKRHELNI